jgi:hypothetical protein
VGTLQLFLGCPNLFQGGNAYLQGGVYALSRFIAKVYCHGSWSLPALKLFVRDTHPAGSLRGDICYHRAGLCFPILKDSDGEDIV